MAFLTLTPNLKMSEIVCRVGGKHVRDLSNSALHKIDGLVDKFKERIKPRVYFQKFEIQSVDKATIYLPQQIELKSVKLAKTLKHSRELVVFAATIGDDLETEVARLMKRNRYSLGYILDAIGSVGMESSVEKFYKLQVENYEKTNQQVTLRFSPGYCDWPLKEQKKIFSLLNPSKINIELLDSCLMQPRKSVSGVFGIAPANSPFYFYNPCSDCPNTTCEARR